MVLYLQDITPFDLGQRWGVEVLERPLGLGVVGVGMCLCGAELLRIGPIFGCVRYLLRLLLPGSYRVLADGIARPSPLSPSPRGAIAP